MKKFALWIHRLRVLFYGALTAAALLLLVSLVVLFVYLNELPRVPEPLSRIIEMPPTEIYSATGERVMVLGGRDAVPLQRISRHFVQAVVATEDHRFWDHHGIDKLRTLKAAWDELFGQAWGTSTITQQLAKNLFFSFEKTYKRKFQEQLVACQIEARFSKEEILEAYINQITFGVGGEGVERASRNYFGKPSSDLSLEEASFLAGLPQSPSAYNPYRHMDRAKIRQRQVLQRMVKVGYITQMESEKAFAAPLTLRPRQTSPTGGNYYLDVVIQTLEERYGTQVVYHGGLRVTTTMDPQMQAWALSAVQKGLASLERDMGIEESSPSTLSQRPQAALVALETASGAVKALVGGSDFFQTEFNRAIENNRLPGSSFKPFTYYAAMEKLGLTPASLLIDKPVTIEVHGAPDWRPRNFDRSHRGPMILKWALMESINSIAAQLIEQTGIEKAIEVARRCGIRSPLQNVYSVALGTSGVSPLEMASAYATLANGGIRQEPFFIWRVEDAYGRTLEEHIVSGERTLDPAITYQMVDMMRGVMDAGTGQIVRSLGFKLPAAGKTGTTNNYTDAWFNGFTPNLSTSVWVGIDDNRGMRNENKVGITGSIGAAPIWADFMIHATEGEPPREFPIPPGIRFVDINPFTGRWAFPGETESITVALRDNQVALAGESPAAPSKDNVQGLTRPLDEVPEGP